MSTELRFDNRVAIVTGAGGGLGRAYAKLLASRGAKVVVNDLGGARSGDGAGDAKAADLVVEEITAAGGAAVANYASVEQGEAIVQTALDAFGSVDILINNAGILRDVSFHKMTQDDWDLVLKVHLTGTANVTRAAWPILREKGYGRVVMTASSSGVYGNFGQANYGAAKLGIYGLANTLAIEGGGKGIRVNTIAPVAKSRMTESVFPPAMLEHLSPDYVAPLVGWLAHENCDENGGLYEVGAGVVTKLRWHSSDGARFPAGTPFTIEDLAARWQDVTNFEGGFYPKSNTDTLSVILGNATKKG